MDWAAKRAREWGAASDQPITPPEKYDPAMDIEVDVASTIKKLESDKKSLLDFVSKLGKEQTKTTWHTDTLVPVQSDHFRKDDIVKIPETGELLRITKDGQYVKNGIRVGSAYGEITKKPHGLILPPLEEE